MTHSISMVRIFDAPRELVFDTWVRADELSTWFAPDGYEVTGCEVDARPGGRWWVEYVSTEGEAHRESGEFTDVVEPERLTFTLTQQDSHGNVGPQTTVAVRLADQDGKTELTFEQSGYTAVAMRDGNAEGWKECFDTLDRVLRRDPI
jgi:uncharacterized protein YndB with AHSA1/START domain